MQSSEDLARENHTEMSGDAAVQFLQLALLFLLSMNDLPTHSPLTIIPLSRII